MYVLLHAIIGAGIALTVEAIDSGRSEVSSRHFPLKKDVELGVCAALGLRQAEERPDEAEEASTGVKETSLSAPILPIVSNRFSNSSKGNLPMHQGSACAESTRCRRRKQHCRSYELRRQSSGEGG